MVLGTFPERAPNHWSHSRGQAGQPRPSAAPEPRWRLRLPGPLARPVRPRRGSDFKARAPFLVNGPELARSFPQTPPATALPLPTALPPRIHVTSKPRRLGLRTPLQSLRRPPAPPRHGPRRPAAARDPRARRGRPLSAARRLQARPGLGAKAAAAWVPSPSLRPAADAAARPEHGDGGEGVRRPGRALPGHRQRHEGNRARRGWPPCGRAGACAGACPLWGRVAAGSRAPLCPCAAVSVCLSASGLRLPCARVSGCPSWGVWVLVCRGVRAVPGVQAPGRPGRSAPLGTRPEPAHTRAPRAPDPQTMNGVWLRERLHGPLTGPGSLRPPPPTTTIPPTPPPTTAREPRQCCHRQSREK